MSQLWFLKVVFRENSRKEYLLLVCKTKKEDDTHPIETWLKMNRNFSGFNFPFNLNDHSMFGISAYCILVFDIILCTRTEESQFFCSCYSKYHWYRGFVRHYFLVLAICSVLFGYLWSWGIIWWCALFDYWKCMCLCYQERERGTTFRRVTISEVRRMMVGVHYAEVNRVDIVEAVEIEG